MKTIKIIDLLNDIENDEIEDGTIFEVIGDFFYKLIVIDKNLYCINERTKQLEILDSKYIGRFDNRQYEIVKLSNKVEEEKKIPEKIKSYYDVGLEENCIYEEGNKKNNIILGELNSWKLIIDKINEILDYLERKGK